MSALPSDDGYYETGDETDMRYSVQDEADYILAQQVLRHRRRAADPDWQLVPARDGLPGLVWRRRPGAPPERPAPYVRLTLDEVREIIES